MWRVWFGQSLRIYKKLVDIPTNCIHDEHVNAKEKAICEKAVDLWAQALDECYKESADSSGITVDIFKGAHFAIGGLKGFWTPSKSGFFVIDKAIADLERLLGNEEVENELVSSAEELEEQVQKVVRPRLSAQDEAPDPRVKWRISRTDDGEDGYIYTTVGVNDYSIRKYYEEKQPDEYIEFESKRILPFEIPLDAQWQDDSISDALVTWIHDKYPFELIRDESKPFQFQVEIYDDSCEMWVIDIDSDPRDLRETYYFEEDKILDYFEKILESCDNFRVVYLDDDV